MFEAHAARYTFFWGTPHGGCVVGPTTRLVGDLAAMLGRRGDARRHYEEAIRTCERSGAVRFLDLAKRGLASLGDARPVSRPPVSTRSEISLVREGDIWLIESFTGTTVRLKDSKGLDEARRFSDPGRAAKAQHELDAIASQLAAALGLGGRDRKAGSLAERARINVQRRIRTALHQIEEHDPALARYVVAAVKTGIFCSYTPV